jgi:histidinol phosphatase-like enzyme (inositol monophosphatase family)
MTAPSTEKLLDFAVALAREAGEIALRHYQGELRVEAKPDASPVTIADKQCERFLRERIGAAFPAHGITGEEFGSINSQSATRWWLDPIDGTQSFIRGTPLWGIMIGLEEGGEATLGVVHFPALRETVWAAKGAGAWWWPPQQEKRPARVSAVAQIEEATLLVTDPRGFTVPGFQGHYEKLRARAKFERSWGDCYGHCLVATGRAEIMLDPVLNPWDACALLPILEEAGGRFVDWKGQRTIRGGNAISSNAALFQETLRVIS